MRQVSVHWQLDAHLGQFLIGLPAHGGQRLADHPHIQIEPDVRDVSGLLPAEQVSCPTDLQILHRHSHSRTQIGVRCDGLQPVVRGLGQGLLRRVQEVGVGTFSTTADPAAQLMQLAETKGIGTVNDQGVRVRDVHPGLHDRGADQHIDPALPEVHHGLLERVLVHLAVRAGDPCFWHKLVDLGGNPVDALHPVVDEEHLPVAQQLTADGRGDLFLVIRPDEGQHRQPVLGWGLDRGDLPDAGDRHLQGPRDRGGGHAQHVDRVPQCLDVLLVLDAEALLLIDDEQPQILEAGLRAQDPVGGDDDIDGAVGQTLHDPLGLGIGLEPRQRLDPDREGAVPVGERLVVLLHQQRGGDQNRHLRPVLDGLERSPHGDLGLAETDVPADQAVHRHRLHHVGLDLIDGRHLIRGFLIGEGILEFALPRGVGAALVTPRRLPGRIELDQFPGDLAHRPLGLRLGLLPIGTTEPVNRRGLPTDVPGDLVELVGGHIQAVGGLAALARVLQHEVLALGSRDGPLGHLHVPADAVLVVHDEVAGFEGQRVQRLTPLRRHLRDLAAGLAGDVTLGDQHEILSAEAGRQACLDDVDQGLEAVAEQPGRHVEGAQLLGQTCRRPGRAHGDHDWHPGGDGGLGIFGQSRNVSAIGGRGPQTCDQRAEGVQATDRQSARGGLVAQFLGAAVGGTAQVQRHGVADCGVVPAGLQELLGGPDQIDCAGGDALRADVHDRGSLRQQIQQRDELVSQDRREALHPLDRDTRSQVAEDVGDVRVGLHQSLGAGAQLLGQ